MAPMAIGIGIGVALVAGAGAPAGYFFLSSKDGSLRLSNQSGSIPLLGKAA